MHSLIHKILQKRGLKGLNELSDKRLPDGSPSEKEVFETWQKILSESELTVEKIKEFCQSQISVIEGKWQDLNIDQEKKSQWIPYHTVYKTLLTAIDAPRSAREALEKNLNQLVK